MHIYIYKYTGIAHFNNAVSTKSCKVVEAYDTCFKNTRHILLFLSEPRLSLVEEK